MENINYLFILYAILYFIKMVQIFGPNLNFHNSQLLRWFFILHSFSNLIPINKLLRHNDSHSLIIFHSICLSYFLALNIAILLVIPSCNSISNDIRLQLRGFELTRKKEQKGAEEITIYLPLLWVVF